MVPSSQVRSSFNIRRSSLTLSTNSLRIPPSSDPSRRMVSHRHAFRIPPAGPSMDLLPRRPRRDPGSDVPRCRPQATVDFEGCCGREREGSARGEAEGGRERPACGIRDGVEAKRGFSSVCQWVCSACSRPFEALSLTSPRLQTRAQSLVCSAFLPVLINNVRNGSRELAGS